MSLSDMWLARFHADHTVLQSRHQSQTDCKGEEVQVHDSMSERAKACRSAGQETPDTIIISPDSPPPLYLSLSPIILHV